MAALAIATSNPNTKVIDDNAPADSNRNAIADASRPHNRPDDGATVGL